MIYVAQVMMEEEGKMEMSLDVIVEAKGKKVGKGKEGIGRNPKKKQL